MSFTQIIKFESAGGEVLFADLGKTRVKSLAAGQTVTSYTSLRTALAQNDGRKAVIGKLLAPVPNVDIPIYCVGLNYRSHAKEASLNIPKLPPVWTKPATALANPGQDIIMNDYCARAAPDYEAELVFVVAEQCKDLSEADAEKAILGYTLGNDLSCRLFQLPEQQGGQFYYAKAFDNFAPIGPSLLSKEYYAELRSLSLQAAVNGQVLQSTVCSQDMVFSPAKILSHMSQGTTIPAGTIVMTGTPAGVGAFQKPKRFLNNGDIVEVRLGDELQLRNKIVFK